MSLELESNGGHKSRARIIRQQLITSDKLSSSFFTMLPINYKGDHLSLLKLLLQFLPFSLRMRAGPGHTVVYYFLIAKTLEDFGTYYNKLIFWDI